jgi:DNA ligase-1
MKCYPFEEKRLAKWEPPYIVQPKYDGWRCRAVPVQTQVEGNYILLSSEENIFYSVPHLLGVLDRLGLAAELDGELYCHGMSFDDISSIVSRTVNVHPESQRIQLHVFDIVNDQPQMKRMILIDALRGLSPLIQIAPFWLCENLDNVMRAYDKILSLGYEGIIVRHFQAPYIRKRSIHVMKFKPKKEDTYEIIDYSEEVSISGNLKGSLGALTCKSGDGDVFNVGTGFTKDQRDQLWKDREKLPQCFVRVQYQHLTAGKKVPRFPVFVEIVKDVLQ